MAVGICGPTVLYTNIIRAYNAEEAARLYLNETNDDGIEITKEMVSKTANKMFEIEDEKALDKHYDASGEQLYVGDTVFSVVGMGIVKGVIDKLTNRSVKIASDDREYTITIGKKDYREIKGEKTPYFSKLIKVAKDLTIDESLDNGSFVAYMDIRYGKCEGFGFGTVTKITPSYVFIDIGENIVIRKSPEKVQRFR